MGKFIGTYNRTLDDKSRLQLPPKLIGNAEALYYLIKGFEGCLSVYTQESFDRFMEKLEGLDYFEPRARKFLRLAASSVETFALDAHGRILIRKELAEEYALAKDIVIIGALDHFEIWDKARYENYLREGEGYEELAASLNG